MNIIIPSLDIVNTNPVEATHASSTRSERYGFISTQQLVSSFEENGYVPRQIQVAKARKDENKGFQKHIIRFQHRDNLTIAGEASPEFVLINSHDGTSSAQLSVGLQVFACLNGLVTGDIFETIKIYHRSVDVNRFLDAATTLRDNVPALAERVHLFKQKQLTPAAQQQYLVDALKLRYDQPEADADYADRYADSGTNLWHTFNRVQENLVKGRPGSGIRRVTAPTTEFKVNKQLWNLSEQYLLNN